MIRDKLFGEPCALKTHLTGVPAVSSVASHVVWASAEFISTAAHLVSLATVVLVHVVTRFYVRYGNIHFTFDSRLREISV